MSSQVEEAINIKLRKLEQLLYPYLKTDLIEIKISLQL